MVKYRTRYEWLDDFGDVVRLADYPSATMKCRKVRTLVFDTSDWEDAPF